MEQKDYHTFDFWDQRPRLIHDLQMKRPLSAVHQPINYGWIISDAIILHVQSEFDEI